MLKYLFIFLISNLYCLGQNYLNVPLISQRNTDWCWAASIDMILNFHNPQININQCEIVQQYINLQGLNLDCSYQSCDCIHNENLNCNTSIQLRINGAPSCYFKKIFDHFGYNATESGENRISWDLIKTEINECRPIIVAFNRRNILDTNSTYGQHCVVIDGYLEQDCDKYILLKDPWEPCQEGCQYALNFDSLIDNNYAINSKTPIWIYNIKPKNGNNICNILKDFEQIEKDKLPCSTKSTYPNILSSPTIFLKGKLTTLSECFPSYLEETSNPIIENKLKDFKKIQVNNIVFLYDSFRKKENISIQKSNKILYYSKKDNFQIVISQRVNASLDICPSQNMDGYWLIESIGNCSYLCPYYGTCFLPISIWVGNYLWYVPSFQVVYSPDFNFTFLRFKLKENYYYYSTQAYKELKMNGSSYFKAGNGYLEEDVLKQILLYKSKLK